MFLLYIPKWTNHEGIGGQVSIAHDECAWIIGRINSVWCKKKITLSYSLLHHLTFLFMLGPSHLLLLTIKVLSALDVKYYEPDEFSHILQDFFKFWARHQMFFETKLGNGLVRELRFDIFMIFIYSYVTFYAELPLV